MGESDLDLFEWGRRRPQTSGPPAPLTVTQLNNLARGELERRFSRVTVVGEISNHKRHGSGHHYFSLKDHGAQVAAALFRREAAQLTLTLKDGLEVVVTGRLTIYGKTGRYQLVVEHVEARGAGRLQAAFEELKRRLEAEGLFAPTRKRPLPLVPRGVAVITSPTGAVIRDIVHVATRRFPQAHLLLVPAPVQGAEAARPLAWALQRVARLHERLQVDVVVLARGGGSLEDLWGFNDEAVARAIAACPIPVVSAVGHETDFTIADFVADRRAATPSQAAELVFPVRSELVQRLQRNLCRCERALRREVVVTRRSLEASRARLGDGRALTREMAQALADLEHRIERSLRGRVATARRDLHALEARLGHHHPRARLGRMRAELDARALRIDRALRTRLREERARLQVVERLGRAARATAARDRGRLSALTGTLHALSPLQVLDRGYGIVFGPTDRVVRSPAEVAPGDRLRIRVAGGSFAARAEGPEDER